MKQLNEVRLKERIRRRIYKEEDEDTGEEGYLYSAVKVEVKVSVGVQLILVKVTAPEDDLLCEVPEASLRCDSWFTVTPGER